MKMLLKILKNKKRFIIVSFGIIITAILIALLLSVTILIGPVNSGNNKIILFNVKTGSSMYQTLADLKNKDLIRNELIGKLFLKVNNDYNFKAGTYELKKSMSLDEILYTIASGKSVEEAGITVTFPEGKRMTYFIKKISNTFNYQYDEVKNFVNNKENINKYIKEYWFLTDEVLNENIFYPLEGYLFPETYRFKLDSSLDLIISKLLTTMADKLKPYRAQIVADNTYSIHEWLTLASLVELEGNSKEDRQNIAQVFKNRLQKNMSLGSDVTTYYAEQKDMKEPLYRSELDDVNAYNTRGAGMEGKLPVGPICNSSLEAIDATFNSKKNDYYYFFADMYGKIYFTGSYEEHLSVIKELRKAGKAE